VTRERDTFTAFAKGFFDSEGEWARKKGRRGHHLSADQCERHARSVKNHFEPLDRRVPLQAVQSATGHLTDEMTQRYCHLGGESGAGIRQIAESLFVEEKKPGGTGRKDTREEAARKAAER
jgi:hypothetical protein